jgi:hypothetical protein
MVAALLVAALVFFAIFALPRLTTRVTRQVSSAVREATVNTQSDLRVQPAQIRLLTIAIVALGVALMLGLSFSLAASWQAVVMGLGVVVLGITLPNALFKNGWPAGLVKSVQSEIGSLLLYIYLQAGLAGRSIDESVRAYARYKITSAEDSQRYRLASLISRCPPDVSPVDFLMELEIPDLRSRIMPLQQVRTAPPDDRRVILNTLVQRARREQERTLESEVKRRGLLSVAVGVLILMPSLMLTVLAPPVLTLLEQLQ